MSATQPTAEDALEDFVARLRRGECVDAHAYAQRHPDLGAELESALRAAESLFVLERAAREDDQAAAIPERVGPFRVVREIGRGGMGLVLEAVEEPLERRVALKLLTPELLASAAAHTRFRREAELAARLEHPGIATVYGAGVSDARPWIAMRFIAGETLAHAIARSREAGERCVVFDASTRGGREAVLAVAGCVARIARALAFAHAHGVVHRDVKPSNVIVTPGGEPVLLDFGLAIAAETDRSSTTRTGETPGTPAYLAPEHVGGESARHDVQSDVYALGVTLYECLTLARPFDGPTPAALYRAILTGSVPDVRALNRSIARDLSVVVGVALERDRRFRYASAADLADDLEACVDGRAIRARPVPVLGLIVRWTRREPAQALLVGALLVALLGLASFTGSWIASREKIRRAADAARARERDEALSAGFVHISDETAARAEFERALAVDPTSLDALAGLIVVDVLSSRPAQARELLAGAPRSSGFDVLRDVVDGRPVEVDTSARGLAKLRSLDAFLAGWALCQEGLSRGLSDRPRILRRADACLTQALLSSSEPRAFYHVIRAVVGEALQDERTVRTTASSLLALWPDSDNAVLAAGSALSAIDPESGLPILERALSLDPTSMRACFELGKALTALGRLEEGEALLWRAVEREASGPDFNSLGVTLALRGCLDDAYECFLYALSHRPRIQESWRNLSMAAHALGHPIEARMACEHLLQFDPHDDVAWAGLGLELRDAGDLPAARAALERSLAENPANPAVWEHLARVEDLAGDAGAARSSVEAGLSFTPDDQGLLALRDALVR